MRSRQTDLDIIRLRDTFILLRLRIKVEKIHGRSIHALAE